MMPLEKFEEYMKMGVVKETSPDKLRADALIKEAKESFISLKEIIEKIGVKETNSNHIIKNAYDVIMELVRAKMLSSGYTTTGKGAHEAEVSYLRKLNFPEIEVEFVNQLRYFRNGITYYGKKFEKDYAQKVLNFLNKAYTKLIK